MFCTKRAGHDTEPKAAPRLAGTSPKSVRSRAKEVAGRRTWNAADWAVSLIKRDNDLMVENGSRVPNSGSRRARPPSRNSRGTRAAYLKTRHGRNRTKRRIGAGPAGGRAKRRAHERGHQAAERVDTAPPGIDLMDISPTGRSETRTRQRVRPDPARTGIGSQMPKTAPANPYPRGLHAVYRGRTVRDPRSFERPGKPPMVTCRIAVRWRRRRRRGKITTR